MRLRQVHLDFHTSEHIRDIGKKFSKQQFQEMLIKGHVDSITLFSKCHHGWAYHPSKANDMHPELDFDLLGAQIEAAHEIGVKTPVYLSAGFDEKTARRHPDWVFVWKLGGSNDYSKPGYHLLCQNSPYREYFLKQIKEVVENYDADGIFLDFSGEYICYCDHCLKILKDEGKDPTDFKNIRELSRRTYAEYAKQVREVIDSVKPGLPLFHNSGHVKPGRKELAYFNTHLELESLPTGGWGYDHFPMSAAYARTLGMDFLGMTGKFHTTWGEFGGFKHPNALKYEVALSAANGAGCSVGDQLAPNGEMDNATYTLIGEAYKTLEEREPWVKDFKNVSDIAILTNEAVRNTYGDDTELSNDNLKSDVGCARILLENHYLFDSIDLDADFKKYKLIIMPDTVVINTELKEKLENYIACGGKILASYKSGMDFEREAFMLDYGCRADGECIYSPTYIRPKFAIPSLKSSDYVIYDKAVNILNKDAIALADMVSPYFNRTAEHFSSHMHAPSNGKKYCDAIVRKGNIIYATQRLFYNYAVKGSIYVKEVITHLIEELIGDNLSAKVSLPAQGVMMLTENADKSRINVHLLYGSPVKRGENVEVIEDIIPVYNIDIKLKSNTMPKSVTLVPEKIKLPFEHKEGYIAFTVPEVNCWQIAEISY